MYNNTWAICCPGPSINLYDTKKRITQVNPDVKVAVNGAILLDSTFDYWAVIDIEVFESIFKLTSGLGLGFPTLWIPAYWQEHISLGYPQLNTFFNSFKHLPYPAKKSTDLGHTMPFGQSISWTEYTLFSAIALAIKKDAKTIRIFGADFLNEFDKFIYDKVLTAVKLFNGHRKTLDSTVAKVALGDIKTKK